VMATIVRSISRNRVGFEIISIGSMSIKRKLILLIRIMIQRGSMLCMFWRELSPISCCSLEFCRTRSKLCMALIWMLSINMIRHKAFIVFSLIMKFISIWLVGICGVMIVDWWQMDRLVVDSVCRVHELRIIVSLVGLIDALMWFLNKDIVGLIVLLISGLCIEFYMAGRAMMFSYIVICLPQVHISHTHLWSDCSKHFWWSWAMF
jgi:hypothetical protein